jgi:hypothetical protein
MYFYIKTSKYINRKRSKLYMFLSSINKLEMSKMECIEKKIEKLSEKMKYLKKVSNKMKIKRIKCKDDFIICKELYTNLWFLKCKNLIFFYIKKDKLDNIENDINDTLKYTFIIYETSFHYIFFCTSHDLNNIDDFLKELILNYSDKRFLVMVNLNNSKNDVFFSNIIILNPYIYDSNHNHKLYKEMVKEEMVKEEMVKEEMVKERVTLDKIHIIIEYIIAYKHLSPHYIPL